MKKITLLFALLISVISYGQVTFTNQSVATTGTDLAAVDMNGDHLDDLVSVTNTNIQIFYQQTDGSFVEANITTTFADNGPSWSLAAADYDGNGYTDLLYGGGSGVTFMRANEDGTAYTEISGSEFVFSQRSNFVDINNDGHLDAFVCHDVEPNVYYINDGTGELDYIQGGLGDFASGGNYGSVWIDFDNDRDVDLFLAKCGGSNPQRHTNELHMNNGDGTYSEVGVSTNLDDIIQTWSSAWGDFDNDGDMDAWVGASTFSDGFHRLMRNNGDGTFTDVMTGSGLESFNVTGIENAAHDFNNDGNIDIASNGTLLIGNGDMTFTVQSSGLSSSNGSFADLNNDGYIDAFRGGTIFMNDGGANNWLKVVTIGTDSNLDGLGARVEIETPSGTQIRDVRAGEGFRYMSSLNTHFGIGSDTEITSVTIYWTSGTVDVYEDVAINETLVATEGEVLGLEDTLTDSLILFPNPTKDVLNLGISNTLNDAIYSVFNAEGKRVLNGRMEGSILDVASLNTGAYILRIIQNGTIQTQRFIKQ